MTDLSPERLAELRVYPNTLDLPELLTLLDTASALSTTRGELAEAKAENERLRNELAEHAGECGDVPDVYSPAYGPFMSGISYAHDRLVAMFGLKSADVTWDAATETLEGDVDAVAAGIVTLGVGADDWMASSLRANNGWRSPDDLPVSSDDALVQVLCRVAPDNSASPDTLRMCNFAVSTGDHAEGDQFVSIGFFNDPAQDGGGAWEVAGWSMTQDCFTDANFYKVEGWRPLAQTPAALSTEQKGDG